MFFFYFIEKKKKALVIPWVSKKFKCFFLFHWKKKKALVIPWVSKKFKLFLFSFKKKKKEKSFSPLIKFYFGLILKKNTIKHGGVESHHAQFS